MLNIYQVGNNRLDVQTTLDGKTIADYQASTPNYYGGEGENRLILQPIVGIGVTAPDSALDVDGNIQANAYCDQAGTCKTIAEMASSGGGSTGTLDQSDYRTIECGNDCGFACNEGEYMAGMTVVGAWCGGECVWASIKGCKS